MRFFPLLQRVVDLSTVPSLFLSSIQDPNANLPVVSNRSFHIPFSGLAEVRVSARWVESGVEHHDIHLHMREKTPGGEANQPAR